MVKHERGKLCHNLEHLPTQHHKADNKTATATSTRGSNWSLLLSSLCLFIYELRLRDSASSLFLASLSSQVDRAQAAVELTPVMVGMDSSSNNNSNALASSQQPSHGVFFFVKEYIWPGLGLFGESYLLFSIGTLKPLWEIIFADCFVTMESCSPRLVHSLTYSVVLGVILGMLVFGWAANRLGRRKGSLWTAGFMAVGAMGLTGLTLFEIQHTTTLFRGMSLLLFVFGIGVGGE
jgi:hypothetical protein